MVVNLLMFPLVLVTFLSDVIRIPKNKLFKEGGGFIMTDRECRVYHHREAMMTEA